MTIDCPQRPRISAADTEVHTVDFTDLLDASETLTGTPTVTEVTTTDLTIANKAVNSSIVTDFFGGSVAVGKAVQFKTSGHVVNTTYTIAVTVTTTSTPARTLKRNAIFTAL